VGNALVFTAENFDSEVLRSSIPVLVDFTATWCGPCKRLAPVIDELVVQYQGKVKVGKLDIDQGQDIASRYGIMSVPTVMVFQGGSPRETLVGLRPKSEFVATLDGLLSGK